MEKKTKRRGRRKKEKKVIGSHEHVDLPDFELYDLPSRVDTGAASSAIHCHKVKLIEREGIEMISFELLDPSHPDYNKKEFRTMDFKERRVRNSFGETEFRYVIKTNINLFGKNYRTEFTLADREKMTFPILLGRKLIKGRFLVDVGEKDLSKRFKKK